ncbi:MAG TPA: hypothetical protein PKB15_07665 [Acidimicrobiia bacterium]|nr:hypothetical protein [Acidimicrobiia bacterium]
MKTKKDAIVEPAVHTDSSTSHDTSLKVTVWSVEESERRWTRALKILETAEPAEVLEKPVQLTDGRWLTAEEVVEYAKTLEEYSSDS